MRDRALSDRWHGRLRGEDATAFRLTGPLDLEHLAAFELHEARMCQIEGNGKTKHALGIEEFLRQIDVRQRCDVARLKLTMEPAHPALDQGALDLNGKVAKARGEQSGVVGMLQDQCQWRATPHPPSTKPF